MSPAILTFNIGSSSIKFALYDHDGSGSVLARGQVEGIGRAPQLRAAFGGDASLDETAPGGAEAGQQELALWLLDEIARRRPEVTVAAVAHRVVHGGRDYVAPVRIDAGVLAGLAALAPLAPGHQPHNLAGIRACAQRWPAVPQVAVFDTAFHRSQPRLAQLFAIPRRLSDEGILRYGFHGLSYDYIAGVLPGYLGAGAEGRVVVAHLGSGASLCALHARRSRATTMGFTALDGLMMGTRCGDIDPGAVLHLIRARGMAPEEVEQLLSARSGLLGVSGISADMRDLLASPAPEAAEAVALYVYRIVTSIGAMAAALGGLDAVVFTAGVGENAAEVRAGVAEGLGWLGAELDAPANAAGGPCISTAASRVGLWVIPTDEEAVLARAARDLLP